MPVSSYDRACRPSGEGADFSEEATQLWDHHATPLTRTTFAGEAGS